MITKFITAALAEVEGSSNSCFVDEIRTDEEFFCANFLSTNKFCPNKVTIKIRS